jgi:cbb3-type cytochrome oxidase subunit 3
MWSDVPEFIAEALGLMILLGVLFAVFYHVFMKEKP